MDNTLLINLSHQLAAQQSMDVIANNIANMSTPAFKREEMKFEEYIERSKASQGQSGTQNTSFVKDQGIVRDLGMGQLEATGNQFDLAINGKGYFVVQTAGGDRYTRNGHLSLDGDGQLVTSQGDPIAGEGGPVTITAEDGNIHIASDGTISGEQGQIGKLRMVGFADERALQKEGASLYSTGQSPDPADNARIAQGMLEASNVQPVVEMSNMIEVMRSYEATSALMQSQEDLKLKAITKLGSIPS